MLKTVLKCECCQSPMDNSVTLGNGQEWCEECAESLEVCPDCDELRLDEEYLFGQDTCDICLERKADNIGDD